MSTYSLPRLLNGCGLSNNHTINRKYASLNRFKHSTETLGPNLNRTNSLNKNYPLHRNQFRGVKKELLEREANILLHSMTVLDDFN